jgi:hypothetical protein
VSKRLAAVVVAVATAVLAVPMAAPANAAPAGHVTTLRVGGMDCC